MASYTKNQPFLIFYQKFLPSVHITRIKCKKDDVLQIQIPFTAKHSIFTSSFEMTIIIGLQDSLTSVVAENFKLNMGRGKWHNVESDSTRRILKEDSDEQKKRDR